MWWILATLGAGIIIGWNKWVPARCLPWVSKAMLAGVLIILFTMGAEVGSDQRLLTHLDTIGLRAFVLAVVTIVGSIAAVKLFERYIVVPEKGMEKEDDIKTLPKTAAGRERSQKI